MNKLGNRLLRALVIVLACIATATYAQQKPGALPHNYPNKPIRMLIGIAPGSGFDIITRVVAQKLGEKWGRPVIVENRTGAGGVLALELLHQAAPDGYTFYAGASQIIGAWPLKKISFDPRKVFTPVVQMYTSPYILVVHPSLPVNSVKEFIAYAKSKPGALSYGSSGVGSAGHISMEIFKNKTGIDMVHVPYKGVSQTLVDLLSGQIQTLLISQASGLPNVKNGKLRAIAMAQLEHAKLLPGLPTISESGVPGLRNFEMGVFGGIYAPAGVPPAILTALHRDVGEILNSPEVKKNYEAGGGEIAPPHTMAQFRDKVARQITEMDELIRTSGIKVDQ